jgi:ABC-2 type transport system ATP-binding protein
MTIVRVEKLSYRYGDRQALNDVSFSVGRGEIFGLLGPNGGGKSTTFRILSTFLKPAGGSVWMFDLDAAQRANEIRKKIGVVFQSGSLDRKLRVCENLMHQGHLYGMSGKVLDQKIDSLLSQFGLSDRAGESVEKLSGGMRRRVEIAKGILHTPELLILDEPSTGLDPAVRLELWKTLERLRDNENVTVCLTTHFMEEADRCDRLAILDRGRIVRIGTPEEMKREVGGEVLDIRSRAPEALIESLQREFGVTAQSLNGSLRIEKENAHRLVPQLVEKFGNQIESVTLGRPTLEDVFIHHTGRRMEE